MSESFQTGDVAPQLSAADQAALEALIAAGWDSSAAMKSHAGDSDRIQKVASLLALMRTGERPDAALKDVTFARIMQARRRDEAVDGVGVRLVPDDEEALESWVMHGFDASRVAGSLRARARKHEALANLVTSVSDTLESGSLINRTLAKVDSEIERESVAMDIGAARRRRGVGIRLADLVSVAAVILIGSAVVLPILGTMREQSRRALCLKNLGDTASAMSTYATANRDSMPYASASLGGGRWWDVGTERSNSANLYTLAKSGYLSLADLACPGNPSAPTASPSPEAQDWRCLEEVSYSYQIMFGPQRMGWQRGPGAVVLADRSPVVLRAIRGEQFDSGANAPNHRGEGPAHAPQRWQREVGQHPGPAQRRQHLVAAGHRNPDPADVRQVDAAALWDGTARGCG
jgi:hypothetical protein